MATKEEGQAKYDELRSVIASGVRKARGAERFAKRAEEIIAEISADADLKTKVQACIDAGPDSLTGLKSQVTGLRAIVDTAAEKFPKPEPAAAPEEA